MSTWHVDVAFIGQEAHPTHWRLKQKPALYYADAGGMFHFQMADGTHHCWPVKRLSYFVVTSGPDDPGEDA